MTDAGAAIVPGRRLLAAVLVGGASSRLGRDKATLAIDGEPLYARVLQRAATVATTCALVDRGRLAHAPPPGVVPVQDATPGGGPLQAACAAWSMFPGWELLLLPCDLPRMTAAHLARLAAPLGPGVDARMPRVDGHMTPLPALYAAHAVGTFEAHLREGGRALRGATAALSVEPLDEDALLEAGLDPLGFHDLDTPSDHARLLRQ